MVDRTRSIEPDRITERLVSLVRIPSVAGHEDPEIAQRAHWLQRLDVELDYWHQGIPALQHREFWGGEFRGQ